MDATSERRVKITTVDVPKTVMMLPQDGVVVLDASRGRYIFWIRPVKSSTSARKFCASVHPAINCHMPTFVPYFCSSSQGKRCPAQSRALSNSRPMLNSAAYAQIQHVVNAE